MRFRPEPSAVDLAIIEEHAPLILNNAQTEEKVKEILKCLRLTGGSVLKVGDLFLEELEKGIADQPSSLLMENTYIPELLKGTGWDRPPPTWIRYYYQPPPSGVIP